MFSSIIYGFNLVTLTLVTEKQEHICIHSRLQVGESKGHDADTAPLHGLTSLHNALKENKKKKAN